MARYSFFSRSEAQAYAMLLNRIYGTSNIGIVKQDEGWIIRVNQIRVDGSIYTLTTYYDVIAMVQMNEDHYNIKGAVVGQEAQQSL